MSRIAHDSVRLVFGWRWVVSIVEGMVGVVLELVVVEGGWLGRQYLDVRTGLTGMVGWEMVVRSFSVEAELRQPVRGIGFLGEQGQWFGGAYPVPSTVLQAFGLGHLTLVRQQSA